MSRKYNEPSLRSMAGGRKSQAGEHSIRQTSARVRKLDNSPDPYQHRAYFVSEPSRSLYDQVHNGVQRKALMGSA